MLLHTIEMYCVITHLAICVHTPFGHTVLKTKKSDL